MKPLSTEPAPSTALPYHAWAAGRPGPPPLAPVLEGVGYDPVRPAPVYWRVLEEVSSVVAPVRAMELLDEALLAAGVFPPSAGPGDVRLALATTLPRELRRTLGDEGAALLLELVASCVASPPRLVPEPRRASPPSPEGRPGFVFLRLLEELSCFVTPQVASRSLRASLEAVCARATDASAFDVRVALLEELPRHLAGAVRPRDLPDVLEAIEGAVTNMHAPPRCR